VQDHRQTQNAKDRLLELVLETPGGVPCEQSPDLFFPEDQPDSIMQRMAEKIAKELCKTCPVVEQCRNYGIMAAEPFGIYGGLSPEDRGRLIS
jgi:WhiB family redox-sensing transcriptional regulator